MHVSTSPLNLFTTLLLLLLALLFLMEDGKALSHVSWLVVFEHAVGLVSLCRAAERAVSPASREDGSEQLGAVRHSYRRMPTGGCMRRDLCEWAAARLVLYGGSPPTFLCSTTSAPARLCCTHSIRLP